MFKEKLKEVQRVEARASDLIKEAAKASADVIAKARESAKLIERQSRETAEDEAKAIRLAIEKDVADEAAAIAERSGLEISRLREGKAEAVQRAAAEIVRRVLERQGS